MVAGGPSRSQTAQAMVPGTFRLSGHLRGDGAAGPARRGARDFRRWPIGAGWHSAHRFDRGSTRRWARERRTGTEHQLGNHGRRWRPAADCWDHRCERPSLHSVDARSRRGNPDGARGCVGIRARGVYCDRRLTVTCDTRRREPNNPRGSSRSAGQPSPLGASHRRRWQSGSRGHRYLRGQGGRRPARQSQRGRDGRYRRDRRIRNRGGYLLDTRHGGRHRQRGGSRQRAYGPARRKPGAVRRGGPPRTRRPTEVPGSADDGHRGPAHGALCDRRSAGSERQPGPRPIPER